MVFKDLLSKWTGKQTVGIQSPSGKMIEDSQGRYRILVGSKPMEGLSEYARLTLSDVERVAARVFQACSDSGLIEQRPLYIFIEAMPSDDPTITKIMNAARIGPNGFELNGFRFDRAIQVFEPALKREMKATEREIKDAHEKAGILPSDDLLKKVKDSVGVSQTTIVLTTLAREFARCFALDPGSERHSKRDLSEVELLTDAIVFEAFGTEYESAEMYAKNGFLASLGYLCDVVEAERPVQGSFQRFYTMRSKARQSIEKFKNKEGSGDALR